VWWSVINVYFYLVYRYLNNDFELRGATIRAKRIKVSSLTESIVTNVRKYRVSY